MSVDSPTAGVPRLGERIVLCVAVVLLLSCARTVPPRYPSYGALMARGDSLEARCRWEEAARVFWEAVRANPLEIEPWLRIGSCLSRSGATEAALAHWDRILAVRPDEADARLGRWRDLLALGSRTGDGRLSAMVRREVDSLAALLPRTMARLELVYQGYRILGEDSLAAVHGAILAFRFPESPLSFDIAMEAYYDSLYPVWNDARRKAGVLRRFLARNPEGVMRPEAYATLAATLASLNRLEELRTLLTQWVREAPEDARALATAAHWYLEKHLGDHRALQYARKAVDAVGYQERPPGYPPERWEMEMCVVRSLAEASYARALLRRGDTETAWRMGTEMVERPPDRRRCEATTAPAHLVLAECSLAMGEAEEAALACVRALEAGDTRNLWSARAESLLCEVLQRLQTHEGPLSYARRALSYPGPVFTDVSSHASLGGVRGTRVAWGDYDGDGYDDLLVDGRRLFRNLGGLRFREVTAEVGLSSLVASGGLMADLNNDGLLDLFAAGAGKGAPDRVLLNEGGVFRDVGGIRPDGFPTEGASLVDVDGDGLLDLYLAKYEPPGSMGTGTPDRLLVNRGEGRFDDGGSSRGVAGVAPRAGRGVSCVDYDGDGDIDIFVSNYRLHPNFLWENDGTGHFVDVACERGVRGFERHSLFGHTIGSDWGDFDGDGDLDLLCANLAHPRYIHFSNTTMLLRNDGAGRPFADVTVRVGIPYEETHANPCWGDFDNDGDLDVYITSVYEKRRSYLLRWDGDHFTDVTYLAGVRVFNAWGCATSDVDGDGDLDLVVGSADGVRLFRNDSPGKTIRVACVGNGRTTNTGCVGCQVTIHDGVRSQVRVVQAGQGTTSQNSLVQHFGVSPAAPHVHVRVRFTDGEVRHIPGVTPGQVVHVFQ